jgi:2-dehydro-3-deoxygluconokinase
MTAEVITLGECLVALIAESVGSLAEATRFERHVVGAESNVAVGLARLGHGAAYIGRVGDDAFGIAIMRRLRGEGVDVSWLRTEAAASTGLLIRERQSPGPSEVLYRRAGSAGSLLAPEDVMAATDAGLFASARWLHITGVTPALSTTAAAAVGTAIEVAHSAGLTISLDINLRRKLWSDEVAAPVLRRLAADVDVIFGGRDEAGVVAGAPYGSEPAELAAALLMLGPRLAVIKLGAHGALALEEGSEPVARPALAVPGVVDPVGAGDAFCAGFIAARLEGRDVAAALRMGNACGAAAVSALGDLTGLPERAALDRLLAEANATDDTLR